MFVEREGYLLFCVELHSALAAVDPCIPFFYVEFTSLVFLFVVSKSLFL